MFNMERLDPTVDSRGIFLKLMDDGTYPKNYENRDKGFKPIQTFISVSTKNTIRGMHFYKSSSVIHNTDLESVTEVSSKINKICKSFVVLSGELFFAAIDLRVGSDSFRKVKSLRINAYCQVSIPRMVASGFQVTSNEATVLYFLDTVHKPEEDITINPRFCNIKWPLPIGEISDRDFNAISLDEYCGSLT